MKTKSIASLLVVVMLAFLFVACETVETRTTVYIEDDGPPGTVYYDYDYYPEVEVYYDRGRHVYYYYGPDGWISSSVLPGYIQLHLYRGHHFRSRYRYPYHRHQYHRRHYGGGRGRGHGYRR